MGILYGVTIARCTFVTFLPTKKTRKRLQWVVPFFVSFPFRIRGGLPTGSWGRDERRVASARRKKERVGWATGRRVTPTTFARISAGSRILLVSLTTTFYRNPLRTANNVAQRRLPALNVALFLVYARPSLCPGRCKVTTKWKTRETRPWRDSIVYSTPRKRDKTDTKVCYERAFDCEAFLSIFLFHRSNQIGSGCVLCTYVFIHIYLYIYIIFV